MFQPICYSTFMFPTKHYFTCYASKAPTSSSSSNSKCVTQLSCFLQYVTQLCFARQLVTQFSWVQQNAMNMLCFEGAATDCHILTSNSCLDFNVLGRSFYQFQCDKQTPGWEDEIKNKEEEREALVIHNEGSWKSHIFPHISTYFHIFPHISRYPQWR